ncbi:hypothetical protein HYT04_01075 [Candidatus Kaiserbacteria bacterium]|nr:hypothetical protein [Candidatus Kaiserbacteria bacterium]
MENETMNQNAPIQNQNMSAGIAPPPAAPAQSSSHAVLYVIFAVVVVAAAGAFWYIYSLSQTSPAAVETPTVTEQTQPAQTQAPASGNTTSDISASLDLLADPADALDADAAAVSGDLQSL